MAVPKVYLVLGHGKDMCDVDTRQPIREQLPDGVTVVERAVCGASVTNKDILELIPKITDPANLATVQTADPAALYALLGSVGIHKSGSPNRLEGTMVKSTISFLLDWLRRGSILIEPSGIVSVPLRQPMPSAIEWTDLTKPLKRAEFLSMFVNSDYPSVSDMDSMLKTFGVVDDIPADSYIQMRKHITFRSNFLDIARRLPPGVYYHLACRAVDPGCISNATLSRQASGLATGRTPEDIETANIQSIVVNNLSGQAGTAKLAATLSYPAFVRFFDTLIHDTLELQNHLPRADALCGPPTGLYELMIEVLAWTPSPDQYKPEFYRALDECKPGLSVEAKDHIFEEIKKLIGSKYVDTAPRIAVAPPQLSRGVRVRISQTDDPKKREERFYVLRRPNATDVNSKGVQFPPNVWMCQIENQSKVVAIPEDKLAYAMYQSGGALGPAKYYRGLSTRRKGQRHREITRRKKMSWKDPKAYLPFKTDKGTRRKPSSYTSRFHTKYPGVTGIPAIAKATGVSESTLHKVYNRGMAAWRTGHRPGASQVAWGMARVYSFVLHGKTWRTADADLSHHK